MNKLPKFTQNQLSNIWHDIMATSAKTYLWAHMNVHEKFAEQALETLHIPVSTLSYKEKALVALAISIALGYKKEDELKHL